MLTALRPDANRMDAFFRMLEDYDARDPENGEYYQEARGDFAAYVQKLRNEEQGIELEEGMVPCSHRWLVNEPGEIVGIVRVRHHIDTPFLSQEAGHIGYDVPPSQRGHGYGIATLKAGLQRANELGLTSVLLCADTANPASWRTIERCGGKLERESFSSEHYHCLVRRYWIEIPYAK